MLEVRNGTYIYLTRGDTARLTVDILTGRGTHYICVTGDTLQLLVYSGGSGSDPVIEKLVTDFSNGHQFKLDKADTENLAHKEYIYDVRLTLENGEEYTIIDKGRFEIGKRAGE